jgi:hypothetical protein
MAMSKTLCFRQDFRSLKTKYGSEVLVGRVGDLGKISGAKSNEMVNLRCEGN